MDTLEKIELLSEVWKAVALVIVFGLLLTFGGCPGWSATQVTTGAGASRAFEDGAVFSSGKTAWTINTNVVWMPTGRK